MNSPPRFYRRPGCLVALGLLMAVAYGLSMLWDAVKPGCTTVVLDRLPSPGGVWLAVDEESTCDVGFLAGSDVVVGVRLLATKPPVRDIQVVGVDTGGYVDERPLVAWSASNVLRITVPLYSYLNILTRKVDGVRVDIHFDPDDPAARAAWLKQTDQSPDLPDDPAKP